ncbi:MAG TPA: hypothetical protein VK425_00975 [Acidimicrobiales bacterium]|nr:hypothetical protein [Acidimicrobiales bacterium]
MSITQMAGLAMVRGDGATELGAASPAARGGANRTDKSTAGVSFKWTWYRHPERLMRPSERLPS